MAGMRRANAHASDDWLAEQQLRAEVEAEAWRRLRAELAAPPPALAPPPEAADPHRGGSIILKALVRFGLGAFGAYLAFLAGVDSGLGEFEIWLAIGAAFLITLALTAFGPLRAFVHFLSETARWVIISGVAFGALWLLLNPPSA